MTDEKQNNLRIIIIDDNPEIHKDFMKILTKNVEKNKELLEIESKIFDEGEIEEKASLPQFEIDIASQGEEGFNKIVNAFNNKKPYALAFVDIRMPPGWDGVETIKKIWEIDPEIQIVICTAYSDYSWEETVAELGEKENLLILKKPFDHIAVRQLSVALTKKWQLMQDVHKYTSTLEQHVQERTSLLQESLSITRGTLESSIDGILVINNEDKLLDFNSKFVEMWDIPENILAYKNGTLLLTYIADKLKNPEDFNESVNKLKEHQNLTKSIKIFSKDNKTIEQYSQPYTLNNEVAGRVWSFRDVTDRSKMEEKIKFQAMHDTLTGLPNRSALLERIHQVIKSYKDTQEKFAILFFDLDRFKLINDSFNHRAGDELLQTVATRVKQVMRSDDFIARLGGDEFVGLVVNVKSNAELIKIATKLLSVFQSPFTVTNHEVVVFPSIGICIYPTDGKTADELLQHSDMAMYRAKELGGNQFQFYTSELNKLNAERLMLEADLHKAIKNKEFILYYQPQLDITQNKIISVEALIRWNHPERGTLLPIDFIPFAEETGLMNSIGNWVLKEACQKNKEWQTRGLPKIRIAVNITTQQFKQPDFVETIKRILQETQLEPQYLEIELTENMIITSTEAAEKIEKLREEGVFIALDDFGTGYSSLNHLRTITIDRLKIDKSFIQNISINRDDEVIVQAIITMAKSLNLEILAEGVETKEQLNFLKSNKCGEVQGFYFSKPLTSEELTKILMGSESLETHLP